MTSFGRGRGWVCNSDKDGALPRPGEGSSLHSTEFANLINKIDALTLSSSIPENKLKDIVKFLQQTVSTRSLSYVVEELYKIALEDRLFGVKLAISYSYSPFSRFSDTSKQSVQSWLLSIMQKDYNSIVIDGDENKKKDAKVFRNIASFLGEILYRMWNCHPKIVMSLFAYLQMLLETATLEDVEVVTTQIMIHGKRIYTDGRNVPQLLEFMDGLREVLISRNICTVSRGMLLYVIEANNQEFNPLSEKLQEFYVSQLGSITLKNMQRYSVQTDKTNAVQVPPRAVGKGRNKFHRTTRQEVPRPIRGSGAGGTRKDHCAKENANYKSSSSFNAEPHSAKPRSGKFTNPKYEHDDRFEKDYD